MHLKKKNGGEGSENQTKRGREKRSRACVPRGTGKKERLSVPIPTPPLPPPPPPNLPSQPSEDGV
jgi:hypothetical protein